jgi:hypothetical protein
MSTVQKKKSQPRSLASKSSSARVLVVRQKVSLRVVAREWFVRLKMIPRRVVNEQKCPKQKRLKKACPLSRPEKSLHNLVKNPTASLQL